jgi:hypothetical protein
MKHDQRRQKRNDLKTATMLASVIGTRAAVSSGRPVSIPSYAFRGSASPIVRPATTTPGTCTIKGTPVNYTGTACIGISVLHKSNAIPVFSSEEIIEIAHMRR